MKRIKFPSNQKMIIISIIFLILVLAIGISFAFFEATVEGNENARNLRAKSAIKGLVLEGTTIVGMEDAYPGASQTISFKVKNTGTANLEYSLDIAEVLNTFGDKSDLLYSISSADGGATVASTQAPDADKIIKDKIAIAAGATHNYTLTLTFVRKETPQNANKSKSFRGRIQINNLKNRLIASTKLLEEKPDFIKGYPNAEDGDSTLSGLYATPDDDGISYVFRGDKDLLNNNVFFADMLWKVLRVNGDGTIRLILDGRDTGIALKFSDFTKEDSTPQHDKAGFTNGNDVGSECTKEHPCEVTYDGTDFSNDKFGGQNSNIKNFLEGWYKENLNSYDDKIAYGLFCNDVSYGGGTDNGSPSNLIYGSYQRLENKPGNPTLICPEPNKQDGTPRTYGGLYKTKIGLITADELNMAGFSVLDNPHASAQNYLSRNTDIRWWSMTPYNSSTEARIYDGINGGLEAYWGVANTSYLRVFPVINLKTTASFGEGDGSLENPFIVS